MRDVIVIGSGISGLFNAYWCVKNKLSVAIVSRSQNLDFSHIGVLNSYLINDFKQLSTPEILDKNLLSWLLKFGLNQANKTDKKLQILYHKFAASSFEILRSIQDDIGDFSFKQSGNLLVFTDSSEYDKVAKSIKVGDRWLEILGADVRNCGFLNKSIKGVIRLRKNARLNTPALVQMLREYLVQNGVDFFVDEAINYENNGTDVTKLVCKNATYEAKNFIQATGTNKELASKLGTNLELIPAKVYEISFDASDELTPKEGILINELLTQISAKDNRVVIQTKPQLNSSDLSVNMHQINTLLAKLKPFSSYFELKNPTFLARKIAITPHFYPYFGRSDKFENLCFCAGFGINEMLFAPSLSKIAISLIKDNKGNEDSDDVLLFSGLFA
jgi:putative FAD dependent oxidoreductase